ncbi:oligosaccharide flippase family protein [Carnobacterium mobile]|uniref:oligosaccharide flippase family protein n=1 Tax=Carnobacterium mobile TaxID=2750 RepID=UPI00186875F2|nr:oligosaccharide flippase family protein [Carnobacterium mobile]
MNSLKKNFVYNLIYQMLVVITPLITSPYISRKLGAEGIGIYSFTYTIANYFLIFAMLGVTNYGNRSIAKVRNDKLKRSKTFWSIYFFQLFLSIISSIIYIIYLVFLNNVNLIIAIIQILLVLSAVVDISWLFFGLELFKITTIRSIGIKIVTVFSIFIFVNDPSDLWKYTLIMVGSIFMLQAIMWPFLKKYITWIKPNLSEILVHIKPNIILFIPVIAISLYKWMDKIMLGYLGNMTDLGYFENAEKIINIPISLITALGTVMLPRMSHLVAQGDISTSRSINEKSMLFVIFMSSGMSFGIVAVSDAFVPLFFGNEFLPAIQIIKFLAPTMILISWANVIRTQYILPNSKEKGYIVSVFSGATVNLIINIILIPNFGAVGAAVGTLCAELTVTIVQTIVVWKEMDFIKYIKNGIPFIIFGLFMYLLVIIINFNSLFITVVIQIVVGAIIYLILSSIYLWFYHKELIKGLFLKK